jgi:hypothetical protein
MDQTNNSKGTPSKDTGAKNNDSDNDVDFKNHSVITNPNPSTATTVIPNEIPVREKD